MLIIVDYGRKRCQFSFKCICEPKVNNSENALFGYNKIFYRKIMVKSALSGLRKYLATKSPLKMMKNDFYFTLKALCFKDI